MIAYICEQGAKIRREGRRLIVANDQEEHTLFLDDLEQVCIFGNVQLTTQAIFSLLKENIDTVFLHMNGRFLGRLCSNFSANVFLRKQQFILSDNADFCLHIAKSIIKAKLTNQSSLLYRIGRSRNTKEPTEAAKEMKSINEKVDAAPDVKTVRGLEGAGAAIYFKNFHHAFIQDWNFHGREKRPPQDPVNILLSFLYTLLQIRCFSATRIAGLDPAPACLHALSYGRDALSLDLMEEFRTMLGDSIAIALLNHRIIDWDDFEQPPVEEETPDAAVINDDNYAKLTAMLDNPFAIANPSDQANAISDDLNSTVVSDPKPTLILTNPAIKKILTAFTNKMESEITHPIAKRKMTYADAIIYQARHFRKVIEGEIETYSPLMLR